MHRAEQSPGYGLEPEPTRPDLPGSVYLGAEIEETLEALCADLFMHAHSVVGTGDPFHLAIALTPQTERLIMKLMVDPKYRSLPWDRTHVFSVRERLVAPDDPAHSAAELRELLADPAGMDPAQIHAIPAHLPDACEHAAHDLRAVLSRRGPGRDRIDAVLVPCEPVFLENHSDPAGRLYGHRTDEDGSQSVMLTTRVLNSAGLIGVLGTERAHWRIAMELHHARRSCGIAPRAGRLRWSLNASSAPPEHAG